MHADPRPAEVGDTPMIQEAAHADEAGNDLVRDYDDPEPEHSRRASTGGGHADIGKPNERDHAERRQRRAPPLAMRRTARTITALTETSGGELGGHYTPSAVARPAAIPLSVLTSLALSPCMRHGWTQKEMAQRVMKPTLAPPSARGGKGLTESGAVRNQRANTMRPPRSMEEQVMNAKGCGTIEGLTDLMLVTGSEGPVVGNAAWPIASMALASGGGPQKATRDHTVCRTADTQRPMSPRAIAKVTSRVDATRLILALIVILVLIRLLMSIASPAGGPLPRATLLRATPRAATPTGWSRRTGTRASSGTVALERRTSATASGPRAIVNQLYAQVRPTSPRSTQRGLLQLATTVASSPTSDSRRKASASTPRRPLPSGP